MPRYIVGNATIKDDANAIDQDELVNQLVAEFDAVENPQPVITEERLDPDAYYVYVIWDKFRGLPVEDRSKIIFEAYRRVEPAKVENIVNAVGFTAEEAYASHLLPYAITPVRRKDQLPNHAAVEQAITDELKRTVLGTRSTELRYPTLEASEMARQRLEQANADVHWVVTQDVGTVSDFYER